MASWAVPYRGEMDTLGQLYQFVAHRRSQCKQNSCNVTHGVLDQFVMMGGRQLQISLPSLPIGRLVRNAVLLAWEKACRDTEHSVMIIVVNGLHDDSLWLEVVVLGSSIFSNNVAPNILHERQGISSTDKGRLSFWLCVVLDAPLMYASLTAGRSTM